MSIANNSNQVWAFRGSSGTTVTPLSQPGFVGEFHILAADRYAHAFMAPGETVAVTGGTGTLQWAIHPDLSAAWTFHDFALRKFDEAGETLVKRAVTGKSALRKAVWTCSKAVYDVGAQVPGIIESPSYDPAEQIRTGLGMGASSGQCAASWRSAEREADNARLAPWSKLVGDVDDGLRPSAHLGRQAASLKMAVQGTLPRICAVFPRC
jgi:hypothetical protein